QQQHVHPRVLQYGIPVSARDHHARSALGAAARPHLEPSGGLSRRRAPDLRRRRRAHEVLEQSFVLWPWFLVRPSVLVVLCPPVLGHLRRSRTSKTKYQGLRTTRDHGRTKD